MSEVALQDTSPYYALHIHHKSFQTFVYTMQLELFHFNRSWTLAASQCIKESRDFIQRKVSSSSNFVSKGFFLKYQASWHLRNVTINLLLYLKNYGMAEDRIIKIVCSEMEGDFKIVKQGLIFMFYYLCRENYSKE